MKRSELKEMIKSMVWEITNEQSLDEDGIGSSAGMMPANSTANISGYDGPFGSKKPIRKKLSRRTVNLGDTKRKGNR